MKNIVETGTVIARGGDTVRVIIDKGESCRKCGNAALGLCKPGGAGMVLDVENGMGAEVGDVIKIGIDKDVQNRGYFLAFIVPLISLVLGTVIGHLLGGFFHTALPDAVVGFLFLGVSLYFSLGAINKMDRTERMHVKEILDRKAP
jgi:sigma-E factor negative regulatory protein RseC